MATRHFLIGAPSSGSGKTTLTIGLLRAFSKRGLRVQPFKCGPDYIDTQFHSVAANSPSVNLDLFLSSPTHLRYLYSTYGGDADVAVTEGVMGLFDGYEKWQGSSAHIAELLGIPVVLVLDARAMAYSAAPILHGFKHFRENLPMAGVIFNKVSSESHYRFLVDACNDVDIPALGYLPENKELRIPSRHLGLKTDRSMLFEEFAEKAADFVERHLPVDEILKHTHNSTPFVPPITQGTEARLQQRGTTFLRSAIALDDAFSFCYHEHINYLKRRGTVVFFSPMHDKELPEADFIYLPGGYPELYLKHLSENTSMQESIRAYVEKGGCLLAECGGMMYLSSSIADKTGREYPMVGIFKQRTTMESMKLTLGYRRFSYNNIPLKGHEFHYSRSNGNEKSIIPIYNAKGVEVNTKLLRYKNTIAGYTHLYWAELTDLMSIFN